MEGIFTGAAFYITWLHSCDPALQDQAGTVFDFIGSGGAGGLCCRCLHRCSPKSGGPQNVCAPWYFLAAQRHRQLNRDRLRGGGGGGGGGGVGGVCAARLHLPALTGVEHWGRRALVAALRLLRWCWCGCNPAPIGWLIYWCQAQFLLCFSCRYSLAVTNCFSDGCERCQRRRHGACGWVAICATPATPATIRRATRC